VAVSTPIPEILVNRLAASSLCTRSASSSFIPFDPLVDAWPLLADVLNEPPKSRSKTVALVRQYLRQIPLELASTLRHGDATLQHERTQLIDERCPLCNQASAHAMQ